MTFTQTLLNWYDQNKRDLPWRKTRDPFVIWVSEIILQQTRVEQGLAYFYRFLESFPSLQKLAAAAEEEVLNVWQGLGYYTRARNMHAAAKDIIENHEGHFPVKYDEIIKLKGVGKYTAAAIASIAFDLPYPVIDGNVHRFFSRFYGVLLPVDQKTGEKRILELAQKNLENNNPGQFNQAVMEFGALQCKPGKPDCSLCPVQSDCFALKNGMVMELPLKSKTQEQKKRYFHYLVIHKKDKRGKGFIYLKKRESSDIWKNLYDFPLIESNRPVSAEKLRKMDAWKEIFGKSEIKILQQPGTLKHVLTHQIIYARFYYITDPCELSGNFKKVSLNEIDKYPVPRLIEIFFQREKFPAAYDRVISYEGAR